MVNAGGATSSDGGDELNNGNNNSFSLALPPKSTTGPPSSTAGDDLATVDPDDSMTTTATAATAAGQQKKRKKAVRACNHCQTAHLTCDDNRPCLRCVKRGLGETCQDGARKKAKYLRDIEDALVNAGKANPTHFIHSPPANQDTSTSQEKDGVSKTTTAASNKQQNKPKKTNKQSQQQQPQTQRQASDSDSKPRIVSPLLPPSQDNTISNTNITNIDQSNISPLHYAASSASLPPPPAPLSTSSIISQSADLTPTLQDSSNANAQLPPNATQNYGNLLSNYDSLNNNNNNNHMQPFNFFNDLNGTGTGNGGAPDFGFNNNSANLEYAVLSSMIQNSGYGNTSPIGFHNDLSGGGATNQHHNPIYQSIFTGNGDYGQMSYGYPPAAFENNSVSTLNTDNRAHSNSGHEGNNSNNSASNYLVLNQTNPSPSSGTSYLQNNNNNNNNQTPTVNSSMPSLQAPTNTFGALPIDHNWPTIASKMPNGNDNSMQQQQQHQQQQQQSHSIHQPQSLNHGGHQHQNPSQLSPSYNQQSNITTTTSSSRPKGKPTISSTGVMKVEDVYRHINKPYNYLEAYHALIRYLQSHFKNKANVLRIIRALSIYRPSIIALHMPLTVEDEIFVERSFQRTLIELEKLISFSGTPTLVWRRTGEIVLVGTEFTLLSEWRREDLLSRDRSVTTEGINDSSLNIEKKISTKGKRRYIFEVFDQDSLVEYYETFAQHAFESSSTTIMFTCSIVTPKGRKVPCTFGYNLKRDIFGLPQMVIGQFLPILTSPDDPTT